jgi:hypothetical protein
VRRRLSLLQLAPQNLHSISLSYAAPTELPALLALAGYKYFAPNGAALGCSVSPLRGNYSYTRRPFRRFVNSSNPDERELVPTEAPYQV